MRQHEATLRLLVLVIPSLTPKRVHMWGGSEIRGTLSGSMQQEKSYYLGSRAWCSLRFDGSEVSETENDR